MPPLPCLRCVFVAVALLVWSAPAAAERDLIVPFHEGGQLVLDQLSGLELDPATGFAYAGPAGVAFRSENEGARTPGGPADERSTTTVWLAPSADVFVTDHVSLGGRIEVRHAWGAIEGGGARIELPSATSLGFLPRAGFYVPFTDRIGLWPRLGIGWSSVESVRFASSGGAPVRETLRAMLLDVDVSVVYRFSETFFMRAGPELGITLGGRRTVEAGGVAAGDRASVFHVSGVIGLGMNIEL